MTRRFGRSLRRTLTWRLVAMMGLVWLLASGFAFWRTWQEVTEAYADQALHLGQVVATTLGGDADGIADRPDRGSARNYFVVVRQGGAVVYRSALAPADPGAAGPGWTIATVEAPGPGPGPAGGAEADGDLVVTVGLRSEELWQLALSVATGVALPLLAGFAVLLVAMITSVRREFAPLDRLRAELRLRRPRQLDPLPLDGLQDEILPLAESLNALLARLSASMDHERRFIADASHELRTPLTAIKAHLQNIDETGLDPETRRILRKIAQGVDRSGRLVHQLLTLARADAGPGPGPATQPLDVSVVAREVMSDLFPEALRRGADLRFEGAPAFVAADPLELGILLHNLVQNAIRHGGPEMRLRCLASDGRVIVEVEDSGPGIPPEDRDTARARFGRGAGARGVGSGLGLSIACALAERWGGTIALDRSRALGGLSVRLDLPAVAP